ncbi:MAG: hypothetical protein LHW44_07135 [Candidatus Cloacimonetes bacterium]|nr:hypothetical protein [Candidatus Cloacimonadota bacterium]
MYPYDKALNNADTSSDASEETRSWIQNFPNLLFVNNSKDIRTLINVVHKTDLINTEYLPNLESTIHLDASQSDYADTTDSQFLKAFLTLYVEGTFLLSIMAPCAH